MHNALAVVVSPGDVCPVAASELESSDVDYFAFANDRGCVSKMAIVRSSHASCSSQPAAAPPASALKPLLASEEPTITRQVEIDPPADASANASASSGETRTTARVDGDPETLPREPESKKLRGMLPRVRPPKMRPSSNAPAAVAAATATLSINEPTLTQASPAPKHADFTDGEDPSTISRPLTTPLPAPSPLPFSKPLPASDPTTLTNHATAAMDLDPDTAPRRAAPPQTLNLGVLHNNSNANPRPYDDNNTGATLRRDALPPPPMRPGDLFDDAANRHASEPEQRTVWTTATPPSGHHDDDSTPPHMPAIRTPLVMITAPEDNVTRIAPVHARAQQQSQYDQQQQQQHQQHQQQQQQQHSQQPSSQPPSSQPHSSQLPQHWIPFSQPPAPAGSRVPPPHRIALIASCTLLVAAILFLAVRPRSHTTPQAAVPAAELTAVPVAGDVPPPPPPTMTPPVALPPPPVTAAAATVATPPPTPSAATARLEKRRPIVRATTKPAIPIRREQ